MRLSTNWTAAGMLGLGLLALPLVALLPSEARVRAQPIRAPWVVPWPSSPSQTAMREAAVWWAHAVQRANDRTDEAQAALRAWDPAAPFDARATLRRSMQADADGFLARALAATHRAERLAQTPAERQRARETRRQWAGVVGS